ncbi:hypothetical protein [uncultured Desulfobacter sp.]|uniref:hypothetical protein n=1 Tax=uncultured Desulfobacter sp. TaxID=240139 RepID=UPI0029C71970|nr:hypothetical protein [uncultured Desulfobacter sp.]
MNRRVFLFYFGGAMVRQNELSSIALILFLSQDIFTKQGNADIKLHHGTDIDFSLSFGTAGAL